MASTGAILIGVYGLIRGLFALLFGIVLVAGGAILGSIGGAVGSGEAAGLGGLAVIMGVFMLVAAFVMWAAAIGLFMAKSWAPLLTFISFGIVAVLGLVSILQSGNLGILTVLILALDALSTGWGAMNAPQIPIGNSPKQPQAV